ncbi:MAG: hypothetical protein GXP22_03635 [Gammaproteobacteria bacterium]|nr:hypothetical protein [Gammaproteobacteria bacterium]
MMKQLIVIMALFSSSAWAHHTQDHLMLEAGSAQVIADTQQGAEGGAVWLLWAAVFVFLLLGLIRWWKGR